MNDARTNKNLTGYKEVSISVPVAENVRLNVISFTPLKPKLSIPVILVTGLGSIMESFQEMISYLAAQMPLIFIETREKRSSQIEGETSFSIETQSQDLNRIIDYFRFESNAYFLMGYSYGATIVAHSYHIIENKPAGIILLEPSPEFHYPKWSLVVIKYFGCTLYFILKPFTKWYLGHFYINQKEDKQMAIISSKSLDNADPQKLRRAILDIARYKAWDNLKAIRCKSLVVGTSKDGLHNKEDIEKIVQLLGNSEYIDMETNMRTHSSEMGEIAYHFFQNLKQGITAE